MKKVQHQSSAPEVLGDSPFQFNPITLVSMLSPSQHFEIAWKLFIETQLLFMVGDVDEYTELTRTAFENLFKSAGFQSMDAEVQTQQKHMVVQLLTLMIHLQEMNDAVNGSIVEAVEIKYRQIFKN